MKNTRLGHRMVSVLAAIALILTFAPLLPVAVAATWSDAPGIKQVSLFNYNAQVNNDGAAIKTDGSLWTWGNNTWGQVGDGTTTERLTPVQIGTAKDWESVSVGGDIKVAIKTDGSLWAWGIGVLGDGEIKNAPVQSGTAKDWKTVAAGMAHMVAIKTDGSLWTWGDNHWGQLGDGTKVNGRMIPAQIGTSKDWASVAAGTRHTVALKKDGSLWAWRRHDNGQKQTCANRYG